MTLIIFTLLILLEFLVIHFTVLWLEKPKAAPRKAGFALLIFIIANNVYLNTVGQAGAFFETVVYVGFMSVLVWMVFKLKPLNAATVAATFLAARVLLVYLVSYLPLTSANA